MKKLMFTRVCASLVIGAGVIFAANGETKTWTNATEDGLWRTAGNWNPEGIPATTDDVVIPDGMTCTWVPGGDFKLEGSLTLGKGAKWVQSVGQQWIQLYGKLTVGEGAEFDIGTALTMNLFDDCSVYVSKGGLMTLKKVATGAQYWGTTTQRVVVDGTIKWTGASKTELTQSEFMQLSQTVFTYSDTSKLIGLPGVQFTGTTEMDFAGTMMELAGFTAQEKGASGARENNELVLKRGKYIVRGDTGCSPRGILGWSPNDTDACKTWVDFPDRSKAEVVFTHTDITNNADVIADPYNVYAQIKDCIHSNNKVYNILYCRGVQIQDLESFRKAFTVWQDTEGVHIKLKSATGLVIRVQ